MISPWSWSNHDHYHDFIMITLMISPLSLQWFNYDQYHDFTMITSKILPESPHVPLFRHDQYDDINRIWPLAWNCQCAFGVSSYSLFCTKKPLRNLITSPPPEKKRLKRHKQTNIHYKILHINMMLLIIFQKLILQMHDYEGLV